jgi:hypothetical protein
MYRVRKLLWAPFIVTLTIALPAPEETASSVNLSTLHSSSELPMDKLVYAELNDDATADMTEDGYVRHRILEIRVRFPAAVIRPAQQVA